ncbi:MAG TPA: cytochrome c [Candidatus Acidoferrales bacterium]|nr:cytochrome c [Candidatus Acidoferrales bacterium]
MKITILILILILLLLAGGVIAAAHFDFSATQESTPLEARIATMGKHWIVSRRAREQPVTEPSVGPASLDSGGMTFNGDCAFCHGQDGRTPTDVGQAMDPRVPSLASPEVQQWSDTELFWIIRNGNRFTGMGAFGKILTDDQIWDLVHYVRSLRDTAPAAK